MPDDKPFPEQVAQRAFNYHRGVICAGELWNSLLHILPLDKIAKTLDGLPAETQASLRKAYFEAPLSVGTTRKDRDLLEERIQITRWCERDANEKRKTIND